MRPYPLLFQPILLPKVWGGDRLGSLGKAVRPGDRVGESWELADLASTAASGAGGAAQRSVIRNGPLAGRTIHDAIEFWGSGLLPSSRLIAGGFPLLVKFLDARENLSVQVHPDAAYAAKHPDASLKTESWYIVDAAPDAVIYKGFKPGVTADAFARIARAAATSSPGSAPANELLAIMDAVPARPGDCHNLPSGTVHAIGAGVLVAEVQTPSDTTFRLYDWGRPGRELHLDQALECASLAPPPPARRLHGPRGVERLVETEFYVVDEAAIAPGDVEPALIQDARATDARGDLEAEGDAAVLIVLSGRAVLSEPGDEFEHLVLAAGDTCLIPGAIASRAVVRAETPSRLLRVGL